MGRYVIICIILFFGCQSPKYDQKVFLDVESIPLKGKRLDFINIGCYYQADILGQLLVLSNSCGEQYFDIYDLNNQNLLVSFGSEGNGPEEFNFPIILKESNLHEIIVHDVNHKRIKFFDIKDIIDGEYAPKQSTMINTNALGGFQLSYIDRNTLVGKDHIEGDGIFFIHNITLNKNNWIEYYPKVPGNTPRDKIQLMYDNHIVNIKEKQLLVVAMQYFNRLNYYDYEGKLLKSVVIGNEVIPDFSKKSDFLIPQDVMVYFIDMQYVNDKIFALFVDKTQGQYADFESNESLLLKFDINGKLLSTSNIEEGIISFTLNDKGDRMYGISYGQDGAAIVSEYDL